MKFVFRSSFEKDAKKVSPQVQNELARFIEIANVATSLEEMPNIKKMVGYKNAFRFRIKGFRGGFYFENGIIEFVRFLPRNSIYKKFP